ncbi:MAG: hypothetical protein H2172_17925 [Opitutus sp.]|nr:hypothetical protein [Opitutus sp.]MCS6247302.1 hypothetical protein [Opitutus sp.]MCS6273783.1 hypothetical protein [Opitutus sp.]MCS6278292.1 hypothetical protein [Opitutus sp.]MCS6299402.1 hypothetical protein [Opitutus sp.]
MATIIDPSNIRYEAVEIIKIHQRTADLKMKVDSEFYTATDLALLDLAVASADKAVAAKRAELVRLQNARNNQASQLNAVLLKFARSSPVTSVRVSTSRNSPPARARASANPRAYVLSPNP